MDTRTERACGRLRQAVDECLAIIDEKLEAMQRKPSWYEGEAAVEPVRRYDELMGIGDDVLEFVAIMNAFEEGIRGRSETIRDATRRYGYVHDLRIAAAILADAVADGRSDIFAAWSEILSASIRDGQARADGEEDDDDDLADMLVRPREGKGDGAPGGDCACACGKGDGGGCRGDGPCDRGTAGGAAEDGPYIEPFDDLFDEQPLPVDMLI